MSMIKSWIPRNHYDDYSDQVGVTLRAYETLVKYAKENNKAEDLKRYVDDVQSYAELKISEGKDKEFGLCIDGCSDTDIGWWPHQCKKMAR